MRNNEIIYKLLIVIEIFIMKDFIPMRWNTFNHSD